MLSTALLLTASRVVGQADESIDPHLKQLTPLVGSWNVTFDWPGISVKEAKVTYRWVLDGKYLEARWSNMDGTDLGPELFTWDPARMVVRMWGFDSKSFCEAVWRVDGSKLIGEFSGTRFTGENTKRTVVLAFKDNSSIVATTTPGGADKPDGTATFVRVNKDD